VVAFNLCQPVGARISAVVVERLARGAVLALPYAIDSFTVSGARLFLISHDEIPAEQVEHRRYLATGGAAVSRARCRVVIRLAEVDRDILLRTVRSTCSGVKPRGEVIC